MTGRRDKRPRPAAVKGKLSEQNLSAFLFKITGEEEGGVAEFNADDEAVIVSLSKTDLLHPGLVVLPPARRMILVSHESWKADQSRHQSIRWRRELASR